MLVAESLVEFLLPDGEERHLGGIPGEDSVRLFHPHHMFIVLGNAIPRASNDDLRSLFDLYREDSGASDVRELLYGLATRRPTIAEKRMHVLRVNPLEKRNSQDDEDDERKYRQDDNDSRGGGDGGNSSTPPDNGDAGAGGRQQEPPVKDLHTATKQSAQQNSQ